MTERTMGQTRPQMNDKPDALTAMTAQDRNRVRGSNISNVLRHEKKIE